MATKVLAFYNCFQRYGNCPIENKVSFVYLISVCSVMPSDPRPTRARHSYTTPSNRHQLHRDCSVIEVPSAKDVCLKKSETRMTASVLKQDPKTKNVQKNAVY